MAHIAHMHENDSAPLFAEIRAESMRNDGDRATCQKAMSSRSPDMLGTYTRQARSSAARSIRRSTCRRCWPMFMAIGEGLAHQRSAGAAASRSTSSRRCMRAMIVGMLRPTAAIRPRHDLIRNRVPRASGEHAMSASPFLLSRSAAPLLARDGARRRARRAFAAAKPRRAVAQAPPAIRVVAAETARTRRDAVGQRHDRRPRGGGGRHRPQRHDRDRAQCRPGRHGEEGRRARRARPLDARHAARPDARRPAPRPRPTSRRCSAQIGDAEVGVQAGRRGAGARRRAAEEGCRDRRPQLDNAVNALDSARPSSTRPRRRWPPSQAQLAVIDAQTTERRGADRQDRGARAGRRAGAGAQRDARRRRLGVAAAPLFRIAIDGEFELAANVAETALPRLAKRHAGGGVAAGRRSADRRHDPPDLARDRPDVAARLDPHLAAEATCRRAPAISRAARSRLLRREGVAVPASAVIYAGETPFLQMVEDGKVRTTPVTLGARAGGDVEVVSGLRRARKSFRAPAPSSPTATW